MSAVGIGVVVVEDLPARAHRAAGLTFKPVAGSPRCPIDASINADRPVTALGRSFRTIIEAELAAILIERRCWCRTGASLVPYAGHTASRAPGIRPPSAHLAPTDTRRLRAARPSPSRSLTPDFLGSFIH